jgi:ABC-type iron transport system FetAB ATPase subunit
MRAGRNWWIGALVALGALAGCAGSEPGTPTKAVPTLTTPAGNAFLEPGLRFSEESVKAYREALSKVDKKIAADDDALTHGWSVCVDIQRDKTDAEVAKNAAGRFEVDDATAKAIVAAAKTTLCLV